MEEDNIRMFFIGPAGSGKSTLVAGMANWMERSDLKTTTVNLDPGAIDLPYSPHIDVRDWIRIDRIMEEHELGPNGAQVAAADMVALHSQEIRELVDESRSHYVLIDTPGQSELFLFRNSSRVVIDALGLDQSVMVYLMDPFLSASPNGFVAQVLLNAIIQFRTALPVLNVVSKADMVEPDVLANTLLWSQDFNALFGALLDHDASVLTQLSTDMLQVMENMGSFRTAVGVSGVTQMGMSELYQLTQNVFSGGEDIVKD